MKKTLVAAGVIIALGVVWTGGAWFTGKQFEKHLNDAVAQANAQLKRTAPESGVEVAYQNYQRGIFSSQLDLVVKPVAGAQNAWLKPDQTVLLKEDVSHGPLPLAQLKRFNLIPSLASVESTLINNDVTKPFFEMNKGVSPFTAHTRVGYSGATVSDVTLQPVNYQNEQDKIAFSGGNLSVSADRKGNITSLNGQIDSTLLNTANEYGRRVQLTINNFKIDGSFKQSPFEEYIGQQKTSLDTLAIAIEGNEMARLEGLNLDSDTEVAEDKKHLNNALNLTINSLKIQNQDLGSSKLALKIGQIDGNAWREFSRKYNAQLNALLAQPEVQEDPVAYQENMRQILVSNLPLLLKSEPVVTIAPLSWKNAKGESTLNLSLFLKDGSAAEVNSPVEELMKNVKSLDGKLVIPQDMATGFMTQIAQLEGYPQDKAEELARKQVEGLAAAGQMFRLLKVDNNNMSINLQYANGQINLNGENMAADQLLGQFAVPGNIDEPQQDTPTPLLQP